MLCLINDTHAAESEHGLDFISLGKHFSYQRIIAGPTQSRPVIRTEGQSFELLKTVRAISFYKIDFLCACHNAVDFLELSDSRLLYPTLCKRSPFFAGDIHVFYHYQLALFDVTRRCIAHQTKIAVADYAPWKFALQHCVSFQIALGIAFAFLYVSGGITYGIPSLVGLLRVFDSVWRQELNAPAATTTFRGRHRTWPWLSHLSVEKAESDKQANVSQRQALDVAEALQLPCPRHVVHQTG